MTLTPLQQRAADPTASNPTASVDVVTNCTDCPYPYYVDGEGTCQAADRTLTGETGPDGNATPEWCPLRSGPRLVQLRTPDRSGAP